MTRVTWRGETFDKRTADMLAEVARLVKPVLDPTQGSYSHGASSAGTHSGGGAVDLSVRDLSTAQIIEIVKAMRKVGFAAWYRREPEWSGAEHIHGIAVGCPDLNEVAAQQVVALRAGYNGLGHLGKGGKDRHANLDLPVTTWEKYKASRDKPKVDLSRAQAAAERDPGKSGSTFTAKADVLLIEKALHAEGLLDQQFVDGHYGTSTLAAYSRWQRKLGYTGDDANGVPGKSSLTKLGNQHGFGVTA